MQTRNRISRRDFIKIVAVGGAAGLAAKVGVDRTGAPETISRSRLLMGTIVNLTVVGDDPEWIRSAIQACLDRMADMEAILSRFKPESQLSQLNRDGFLTNAAHPLLVVVRESQRYSQLTGGGFDISIKPLLDIYQQGVTQMTGLPSNSQVAEALEKVGSDKIQVSGREIVFGTNGMGITVDGIAKGYIVDQGVAILRQHGFGNVLVEAGGDLMALGSKSPANPWQIGIQSPRGTTAELLARVPLQSQAVATSGDYHQAFSPDYRHHHIINPHTGYSSPELASATVIAPTVMQADVLATTALVQEAAETLALVTGMGGCEAFLVTKGGEVLQTSGWGKNQR